MAPTGKTPFIIEVDTTGLDRMLSHFVGEVEKAVRPAAQAGAQVLYDQVKLNVGQLKTYTGNLQKSIYQVYNQSLSGDLRATYDISWNKTKAPHGWLVERGHLQRYRYYQTPDGRVRPMVRQGASGKKKPGKGASQSVKDAYYVTLPSPIQIPGKAFIRRAADKMPQALVAMEYKLFEILGGMK